MWLATASFNGEPGIERAAEVLRAGGTALDAVEAGIQLVESNVRDDSVGLGGLPNVLGKVELDASIMDGRTLAAGAIGALQGYEHPISIARCLMERSPHVLLVGEGARRFAAEMGFPECELLTIEAQQKWREGLLRFVSVQDVDGMASRQELLPIVKQLHAYVCRHGTVNFLARDQSGDIACGVSTSGWPWKYPGRLGDSPVVGAGNYADNRYGAAACKGYGELAIRMSTARSVVLYMKMGKSVEEACYEAMLDIQPLLSLHGSDVCILAIDSRCHFSCITNEPKAEPYWVASEDSATPQQVQPAHFSV